MFQCYQYNIPDHGENSANWRFKSRKSIISKNEASDSTNLHLDPQLFKITQYIYIEKTALQ